MEPDDPAGRGSDAWLDSAQARATGGAPPPSARVGRRVAEPEPVSPLRALAGAVVAVAGVALGIAAVLTLTEEPDSSLGPTVAAPSPTATPTAGTSPAPALTTSAPVLTPTSTPIPTPTPIRSVTTAPAVTASPRATATRPPAPRPTAAPTTAPAPVVAPVTVLNNSRITGLADRAAGRFAAAGWPIRQVGNFTGKIRTTTVYYLPGQEAVARRFAAAFDVPRVLPRFSGLPGSGLTVVLTRDYA